MEYQTDASEVFGMIQQLSRLAKNDVTLLLIAETDTGKSTIARLMQEFSARRDERFLAVACGAPPPEPLDSRGGDMTPLDLAPSSVQAIRDPKLRNGVPHDSATLSEKVAFTEREFLEKALEAHGNKRTATAHSLGISRVGLYKKMKKYGMITRQPQIGHNGANGNGHANGPEFEKL